MWDEVPRQDGFHAEAFLPEFEADEVRVARRGDREPPRHGGFRYLGRIGQALEKRLTDRTPPLMRADD
jgi:hypothetical protein